MADTRLRSRHFARLAGIFLVLAAFGLAFHALTDAVCVPTEYSCTSPLKTSAPSGSLSESCGIIHAGCLFPVVDNFVMPLAFVVITGFVVIHLTVLRFSPPIQPPKQLQTQ